MNQAADDGATPLSEGHCEVVSMLLAKEGVDVNQAMDDGFTPLYIASQNGHCEVVSMLLAKEGDDLIKGKAFCFKIANQHITQLWSSMARYCFIII